MSGTLRRFSYTHIIVLVLPLLLVGVPCCVKAGRVPSVRKLLQVMKPSMSVTSRLHAMVTTYQHDPYISSDVKSSALLSNCAELTSTSRDAVHSVIIKLQSYNGTTGLKDMEDLRTSLSAALTDVTTCTDGLEDELPPKAPKEMKKAVTRINKQAAKASHLLSKALSLLAP